MIPINLKIQGFLTFKSPVEINFDELNEDGIFLISGPTGSGKTSIFDAISFALYGVATTSGRNSAKDLRSHLIALDEDLIVDFKFRAGAHDYEIKRWQKGQGDSKQRLVVDGNEKEALTKVTEIKTVIGDALGLTADQFCKIVMLPQGEFRNFLVASSKEKSDILRKLFDTEHYAKIRYLISEKLKGIYAKFSQAETIINSEKQVSEAAARSSQPSEIKAIIKAELEVVRAESEALQTKLKQLRLLLDNLSLRLDAAGKLNSDLAEKAKLEEILKEAQKLEADFTRDLKKADKLNELKPLAEFHNSLLSNQTSLERKAQNLTQTKVALDLAMTQLTAATEAQKVNPGRRNRLTEISKAVDKLGEVLTALTELAKTRAAERQETKLIEDLTKKISERDRLNIQKIDFLELNQGYSQKELEINAKCSALKEQVTTLNQTIREIRGYQAVKASLTQTSQAKVAAEAALNDLKNSEIIHKKGFESLKEQYDKQGLAQFTHLIIAGEACPLCGALEHPTPYSNDAEITNSALKAAETTWRQAERQLVDKESNLVYLQKEIEQIKGQIVALEDEFGTEHLEQDLTVLDLKLRSLEEASKTKNGELHELTLLQKKLITDLEQTERDLAMLKDIQTQYDVHKDELTRLKQIIVTLQAKTSDHTEAGLADKLHHLKLEKAQTEDLIQKTETAYKVITNRVTELTTSLKGTEEDITVLTEVIRGQEVRFEADLTKLDLSRAEFKELEAELATEQSLRKDAQNFFKKLDQTKTRFEMMKDKLDGKSKVDVEELEHDIIAGQATEQETSTNQTQVIRRESQLENALAKISTAADLYEKYDKELKVARILDGTTGRGTTFENYVLGYYLDGVLVNTNVRLKKMTNGRFTLVRQAIDTDAKRSIEGLDINVYDTYSNSERDVKTLSGGESFKAALAMALGLSDFIQENKSGIRLDTIFIDEGFGTLDQESLDQAMETILEIQDLGRLVGIISHVEELKERIPTQVIVENKGAEGSFLKIVKH